MFLVKQSGDDGWVASDLEIGRKDERHLGVGFRETSFAHRDDGAGDRVWKVWHFHCSPSAPTDATPPGIGDTWGDRGGAIAQEAEVLA